MTKRVPARFQKEGLLLFVKTLWEDDVSQGNLVGNRAMETYKFSRPNIIYLIGLIEVSA
jgi:hypothetical protein